MHIIMQPVFSHNLTLRIVVCGVYRLQQQWQLRCVTHFRVRINEGGHQPSAESFCAVQVCDATTADSSTAAGLQTIRINIEEEK